MIKLYIVRHPQAEGNVTRRFQGTTDTALTDIGLLQKESLAHHFENIPLDIIYSSRLTRANSTAKAICERQKCSVITDNKIAEINAGDWEGREIKTFPRLYPVRSFFWNYKPESFKAPNGETMREVYKRGEDFLETIEKNCGGMTVLAVSHGCFIRNLICKIKFGNINRLRDVNWAHNAGITYAETVDGVWNIKYEDDISYLPDTLK
jgi:probable phosphoglycerate mutase